MASLTDENISFYGGVLNLVFVSEYVSIYTHTDGERMSLALEAAYKYYDFDLDIPVDESMMTMNLTEDDDDGSHLTEHDDGSHLNITTRDRGMRTYVRPSFLNSFTATHLTSPFNSSILMCYSRLHKLVEATMSNQDTIRAD